MKVFIQFLFLFFLSFQLFAAPITNSSDPALTGGRIVDFESESLGSKGLNFSSGGVSFSHAAPLTSPSTFNGYNVADSTNAYARSFVPVTSQVLEYDTKDNPNGDAPIIELKMDFGTPTSAFGLDMVWTIYPLTLKAYDASNNLLESVDLPPGQDVGSFYAGISSTSSNIKYALLSGVGSDTMAIDNVAYIPSQVPIPAAFWLFLPGMLSIFSFTRQR